MFVRSDLVSYGNRNHTLHSNHTAAVRKNKTPNQTTKQNIPHHTTLFGLVWEVNKRLIWSPLMICNTFSLPQNRMSDFFKIRVMQEILLFGSTISGHFGHSYLEWSKWFWLFQIEEIDEIGEMDVWLNI